MVDVLCFVAVSTIGLTVTMGTSTCRVAQDARITGVKKRSFFMRREMIS